MPTTAVVALLLWNNSFLVIFISCSSEGNVIPKIDVLVGKKPMSRAVIKPTVEPAVLI